MIQLEESEKLSRIVIDECHVALIHRKFRPVMRRLGSLVRCVSVPLVLLTATLPVIMEEELRIFLGCIEWEVIRKNSERSELQYQILDLGDKVDSKAEMASYLGQNILTKELRGFEKQDRAIIYCLETKWATELAEYINKKTNRTVCGVYHSEMEKDARKSSLKSWKEGKLKILTATSALGAGLDYSSVRLIVHFGFSRSLMDFCQETGRAGRDGKMAKVITLFWKGIVSETQWISMEEKKEMLKIIQSKECIRWQVGRYLNGVGVNCLSDEKDEICGNCLEALEGKLEHKKTVYQGQKRGRDQERIEAKEGSDLKEMLKELRGCCSICWIKGDGEKKNHEFMRCR